MNKEELNNIVCQSSSDYNILDEAINYIDNLEKEKENLIKYIEKRNNEYNDILNRFNGYQQGDLPIHYYRIMWEKDLCELILKKIKED